MSLVSQPTEIRPASKYDAQELASLTLTVWRESFKRMLPEKVLSDASTFQFEQAWRDSLTNPAHCCCVCKRFGQIVGGAMLGPSRDADANAQGPAELYGIYLLPEYWDCGKGWAMWQNLLEQLRGRAFTRVTLWVWTSNLRAKTFFERIGFQRDSGAPVNDVHQGIELPHERYTLALP